MTTPVELRTDGPHSPEYTKQVANLFAEAARVLNYCSMPGNGGLDYPGDADSLIAGVYIGTGRLPQLCAQLTRFLDEQGSSGRLADDHGREVSERIATASLNLGIASQCAVDLTAALQAVQNAIAGLYVDGADG